jgi:hypothetical protein
MTITQQIAGEIAKEEGHQFERLLAAYLTEKFGTKFIIRGQSNTKVDVESKCNKIRLSVKNPSNKNTQVGLYTQNSFIKHFNIIDEDIIKFINMFFGGDNYSDHNRHRLTKKHIDGKYNEKFIRFLTENKEGIFNLLLRKGSKQVDDVNYLVWAREKNNVENVILIELDKFIRVLSLGKWFQNETTFEFRVGDTKYFHLQMKGSGKKYSAGYHGLMFHLYGNFHNDNIESISILEKYLMLNIRIAKSELDKKIANDIVVKYHSYVASSKTVGRCIKYIINYDNVDVGTFWLGSGFKPTPKDILNHFNKSQQEFDLMFNSVADNKRFCMAEKIPNLGSQILKNIRNRAKSDWYELYGDNLLAIITTIGDGKKGSVYLADNWKKIGETSGLPPNRKSVSMKWDNQEQIKEKYVKPTGENKKIILITDRLVGFEKVEPVENNLIKFMEEINA